ncbi:hypothetical protein BDZ91DRAFT_306170 [Kalaharituber pfeilii]|nr:hypothetical protein BDZ91DRAFT_306170 [Kalaharituber pfeilii]
MKCLTLLAAALSVAHAAPSLVHRHTTLSGCLVESQVPYIGSSSTNWTEVIEPFNLRAKYTPVLLAIPETVDQVSKAVKCAAQYGVKVQARGGGHSYAAMGLGGTDGSFVVDMKKFKSITLQNDIATVGAGVRVGDLATYLYNNGQRAIPHGLCPGIGIAGHALHGGFGMASRMWGITLDNIIEMQVVLADGSVVPASASSNPDLFWALRGAGSSYGIVTYFKLITKPAPSVATYYQYNYYHPSITIKTQVIMAMQEFGATLAPKELALRLFFDNETFQVYGVYWGPKSGWKKAIAPLLTRLPIAGRVPTAPGEEKQWLPTLVHLNNGGQLEQPLEYDMHATFFAKSIVTPEDDLLDFNTVKNFFTYLATVGQVAPVNWWVIYDLYGGVGSQISAPASSATAYAHRDSLFTIQIYSIAPGQLPPYPQAGYPFVDGIVDSITKYQNQTVFKAYANYIDPTLTKEQAWDLYYGQEHMVKLNKVKDLVDPKRVFWNPQAIRA